jgi:hypothetical protein
MVAPKSQENEISRDRLAELLNEDLSREYQAIIAYVVYSQVLKGNADKVLGALSPRESDPPSMPPGGPYWPADQLTLFAQWQKDGYQP